jgi:hypothetical protein
LKRQCNLYQWRYRENYKKNSSRPRNNLTNAERKTPRTFKKTDLAILPANKGNATVILNTVDYKQMINSLLE